MTDTTTRPPWIAVDTETSHLDPLAGGVPWDIAIVEADGTEHVWTFPLTETQLALADPESLAIGGYYDRVAALYPLDARLHGAAVAREQRASAIEIVELLRGAIIVGVNPPFDVWHLRLWIRSIGVEDPWSDPDRTRQPHYRPVPIDAVSYGTVVEFGTGDLRELAAHHDLDPHDLALPWRSDAVAKIAGVTPPSEDERHTALGDARWVHRWAGIVGLDWINTIADAAVPA